MENEIRWQGIEYLVPSKAKENTKSSPTHQT